MASKALQIIIPSGEPNGLRKVAIMGWNGECFIVPRQELRELDYLDKDHESSNPALYFLFGRDEASNDQLVYVGETENFFKRLSSHNVQKEYWDEAIVFAGELNKAHVKYLEHKAVQLARQAARMEIKNNTSPTENRLSEYDKADMDQYFENVQFVLGVLNYEIFKTIEESVSSEDVYYLQGNGFDASAKRLDNGGMIVFAGSLAGKKESNSFGGWARAAREQFLKDGSLVLHNDLSYRFVKDIVFRKPSAAAATVAARSINGWTAWRDGKGNTLDENVRKK